VLRKLFLVWIALALVAVLVIAGQIARAATPAHAIDHDPLFSPDGSTLAFVRTTGADGRVYVRDMQTGTLRALTPPQQLPYWLTWAPDGSALAYVAGGEVWRVDLAGGAPVQLTHDGFDDDMQTAWSPDGTQIAYTHFEVCFRCTAIYTIAPDGTAQRRLLTFQEQARRVVWSPDGQRFVEWSGSIRSAADGTVLAHVGPGTSYAWASTDELAWRNNGFVWIGAADGTGVRRLAGSVHATAYVPAWNRTGTRIAFGLDKRLAVTDLSGHWRRLAPADVANDFPTWAPNGTIAYVEPGRCGIDAILADGTHHRRLTHVC
jgi:Tol biopolymer transport system component